MKSSLLLFVLIFYCAACRTGSILERKGTKRSKEFEIGYVAGCCGCSALWYSRFKDKIMNEQFIYETECGMGSPTVFQFTTDSEGNLQNIKRYVAVSDTSATNSFDDVQKSLLAKLDSVAALRQVNRDREFKFSKLVGYREIRKGEGFHPFWVNNKLKSEYGDKK
ncbi:MAG: hypothetical protein QM762_18070 [Chryseolinea sp.]